MSCWPTLMASHTVDFYESSHECTFQIDDLTWYSSSREVLEVKIFHCHLVTTRPCQPGLTHQGFLHLTKSIYFSSIEGDISRRGLSDIHSFWIEKIVMSVDHGSNKLKRMKPQATSTLDFLKTFESIYMISTLKPITFESRSTPKRTQAHLKRKQCGIKAHKPRSNWFTFREVLSLNLLYLHHYV